MTNGNTNEEWLNLIEKADKGVPTKFREYKAPGLGTPEFAECIDHTLLKLDATKRQIEELCEQARIFRFKVSRDHLGRCQFHSYLADSCFLGPSQDCAATSIPWQGISPGC